MKQQTYGIHWFRRDLRVAGNPALNWNLRQNEGRVLGVFFFDSAFLARKDFSHVRFAFFLNTLEALKEELVQRGGDLLVLDILPAQGFTQLISALDLSPAGKPSWVSFNRDYEPFARKRDAEIELLLQGSLGVGVYTERDHLLVEPHELQKKPGKNSGHSFYQIYSPFAQRWFELLRTSEIKQRLEEQRVGLKMLESLNSKSSTYRTHSIFKLKWPDLLGGRSGFADQLQKFKTENSKHVNIPVPKAGALTAYNALKDFQAKMESYDEARDFPAIAGTSQLSIYLKNGSLTVAQIIAALDLDDQKFKQKSGPTQYLKELAWREFYYHILYHCPRVEHEAFLEKYKNINWENREDFFEAWKQGRTGYPIVDAGMRQLKQTGWMHNRVRMIVASFLTKDLLIDWRWGERYFMEALLDGDLAPNNGGWQWAASTGCDPQPYFRIFNPVLQSMKFDPQGTYIKQYLPERRHLSGKDLHEPIDPIVTHASQKIKALALYKV